MQEKIREGFDVFLHDGEKAVGAVREVSRYRPEITIYVEGAGDFIVPIDAITDVHSEKVILNGAKLEHRLQHAIGHEHEEEDPNIP